jgi:lipoyl-dependent peroxiredoxin
VLTQQSGSTKQVKDLTMTTEINPLYTTHASSTGGRNGNVSSADGIINVQLSVPKAMGGPGTAGTTTPEDLFASGYAACFGGACEYMSKQLKMPVSSIKIDASVSIGQPVGGVGFGLAVKLHATMGGVSQEQAEQILKAGHQLCPYSIAVRGNIPVEVSVSVV